MLASHTLDERRLAWAAIAEPAAPGIGHVRINFRKGLVAELQTRIGTAVGYGYLPDQDLAVAAPAIVGALLEGLIGPLAPDLDDPGKRREAVQNATLVALRALGIIDARARGLVAQLALAESQR
jgi:hypothetical protein